MKTNSLKTHLKFACVVVVTLIVTSCSDDSSGTPLPCADFTFYGLRVNDANNSNGNLEYIKNTTNNLANPSINILSNFPSTNPYYSNHPAFNRATETIAFIDAFNGGGTLLTATPTSFDDVVLSPAGVYGAPIYVGNQLYALEFDTTGIYLCSVTNNATATRVGAAIGANNFYADSVGNRAYGVLSNSGSFLFLIQDVLYEITQNGMVLNTTTVASNAFYYDIEVDPNTGGLFLPKWDNITNTPSIVHWDYSGGSIVESTIIPNIPFNRETVSLAFNNCGDRLMVLSNLTFINNTQQMSTLWEIEIPNSPNAGTLLNSNSYSEFLLGIVY